MKKTKPRSKKSPARTARRGKPSKRSSSARAARSAKRGGPKRAVPKRAASKARRSTAKRKPARASSWLGFVEKHGVVLASARGPVPSVAEAIAGEPIVGNWWAHPKAQAIFDTLSAIDDDVDVRCFKLVDGKVTFVHRRVWPAIVRLARDGLIAPGRVASVQQEHMPTGEHRNIITPFPEWVPDEVARAADKLSAEQARAQLGSWA